MPKCPVSILLVEDHPGDARLVKEFLRETEFDDAALQHVSTLAEAVGVELDPSVPQCALVDLTLPDAHGARVLQEVQQAHSMCAVIALTGLEDEGMAIKALKGGAQGYLEKGHMTAYELGRAIRGAIERHGFLMHIRQADRAVYLRERRFRALMEHSNDLTVVTDTAGMVTYLSPTAERVLNCTVGDGGLRVSALFDPADRERVRTAMDLSRATQGSPVPVTARALRRHEGRQIWLEGMAIDLSHEADLGALVLNLHDITARHEMTEALKDLNSNLERRVEQRTLELRRMEADLRVALAAEQELNELRIRFVSMAGHEFRTPLGLIMGSAELIETYNGQDPVKVAKHANQIKQRVRDLASVLRDFLSLEKLEKGLEEPSPVRFSASGLFQELIDDLQMLLKPGQLIEHEHDIREDLFYADRKLLAIVLRNLLINSSKYSPAYEPILLKTFVRDALLVAQVTDRGIGIPVSDQAKVFDRFFRASNTQGEQGTGLGLHIVKRYVDLMGGEIRFTSVEGEGSTFILELPLTKDVAEKPARLIGS